MEQAHLLRSTNKLTMPALTFGWADQAYVSDLVEWAAMLLGITLAILKRPARQKGIVLLAWRWVVERTIAWLNRCRLSKDFEHLAKQRAAWIEWASIQPMLR